MRYISREYGSGSYMKVIGSSSRSQEQRRSKNAYSRNVKLPSAITIILENRAAMFACSMGFTASRIEWRDRHLFHVTGSVHT